ncbi:hypothetical protein D3C73_1364220 [compost metagenome]
MIEDRDQPQAGQRKTLMKTADPLLLQLLVFLLAEFRITLVKRPELCRQNSELRSLQ